MKILILVQCVDSERYPELIKLQQETWDSINHPNITTLYYYPVNDGKVGIDGNRININGDIHWHFMFSNLMKALREVLSLEWDYIVKTDTSSYINKHQLYKVLEDKPRFGYYGGHLYPKPHPTLEVDFLWGECLVLSKDVVIRLIDRFAFAPDYHLGVDDAQIASILKGKVEPDTTLTICKYYEDPLLPNCHAYRCKNDLPEGVQFDDEIKAMKVIHENISVSNVV